MSPRPAPLHRKQALWFAALASMKNYMTLHLMPVCGSPPNEIATWARRR